MDLSACQRIVDRILFKSAKTELYCNLSTHSSFGQNLATITNMPFFSRIGKKVHRTGFHSENVDFLLSHTKLTENARTVRGLNWLAWCEMGADVPL
jgi:hypothetical protein